MINDLQNNQLYLELIKDEHWMEFFDSLEGKDKEIFIDGLHKSEIERLKNGEEIKVYKGKWLRKCLESVNFELSMRGE